MKITAELLEKYQLGLCTPAEKAMVEDWLEYGTDEEATLRLPAGESKDAHLQKIWQGIEEAHQQANGAVEELMVPRIQRRVWYVAAAAVLLIIAIGGFRLLQTKPLSSTQGVQWDTIVNHSKGARAFRLADNSLITLNKGGRIRYPHLLNAAERRVELMEGEAMFEIAHDTAHPFLVQIGQSTVQVLGTSFNIQPAHGKYIITLLTGKITFNAPGMVVQQLSPGQQLVFDTTTSVIQKKDNINIAQIIAWKTGELLFEDTPLPEVLETIGNYYEVRFAWKTDLRKRLTFSGRFKGESLQSILAVLSAATDCRFGENRAGVIDVQ